MYPTVKSCFWRSWPSDKPAVISKEKEDTTVAWPCPQETTPPTELLLNDQPGPAIHNDGGAVYVVANPCRQYIHYACDFVGVCERTMETTDQTTNWILPVDNDLVT